MNLVCLPTISLSLFFTRSTVIVLLWFLAPSLGAQMPGRCESPISERKGDIGCYVLESKSLGRLPAVDLFWHVYVVPSRAVGEGGQGAVRYDR